MAKRRLTFGLLAVLAAAGLLGADALGPGGGAAGAQASSCEPLEAFDVANFPDSPRVDNEFLPLVPGTRLVFEGRASRTGEPLPHRVEFTVTDLTKSIDGVRNTVVWDVDSSEGQLIETELAFFAQDAAGNVWSLGEYPEEYEGGEFVGAPSTWIHGQGDAEGGIHMPGDPQVGVPEYLQGSVPSIEFLDCAQIVETGGSVCPPAGCFNDVLLTHERSPLDPGGGIQTKAHAPGVGIVEIGAIDDPEAETLVLVEIQHLDAAGLDAARSKALELEGRAYQQGGVYAATPPMERLGGEPPPVTTVPPPVEPPTTHAPPPTQAPPTTAVTVPPTSTPARSNAAARSTVTRGLALTGSDTISLAMVGALFFAIGVALVVVTRRRSPRP